MAEYRRAVAYVRVSSVSQVEGYSLDAQERAFYDRCKSKDWEPVKIYRDEGKSAHVDSIAKRPAFNQLLNDSDKHEFDIVVVHTYDRWSRNLLIKLESIRILEKNNVRLISISEDVDFSRPDGRLSGQILGAVSEHYSAALSNHVKKGIMERVIGGLHLGCIPFGYESCWELGEKGEKKRHCLVEHQGGIHIHPIERQAVEELFRRYVSGMTTLSQLAFWLNEQGFRTRNTKNLPDANGNLVAGPRLFTSSSVRNILHNPFYTGQITHHGKLMPGAHQSLISQELFDLVQLTLRKNSGRSETLKTLPDREYLLKGLVRCAHCGMPMWAQTYKSGNSYYREHKASRSIQECPGHGGTIACQVIDKQIRELVSAIELGPGWLEEVLSIISLKDEVERVRKERDQTIAKLHRMAKAFVDGYIPEDEYSRQKKLMELSLESLVVPDYNAAEEAGKLILNLPTLWSKANLTEQRKILLTMLDGVYVDVKERRSVIAVKAKPPFRPIFQVAVARKESKIHIINEPLSHEPNGSSVFLVETGEGWTLPETMVMGFAGC
nr:hypothetical protein DMOBY_13090 [Dehalococcoides mccartyi]